MGWGVLTFDLDSDMNYEAARDAAIEAAGTCGLLKGDVTPSNTYAGETEMSPSEITKRVKQRVRVAGGVVTKIYCIVAEDGQYNLAYR